MSLSLRVTNTAEDEHVAGVDVFFFTLSGAVGVKLVPCDLEKETGVQLQHHTHKHTLTHTHTLTTLKEK